MMRNLISSTNVHADWIEWEYEGVVESPGSGLEETNFTVRTVWTAIDLLAAPVRLEPVTAAANAAGTVVNPAGVAVNGVAVYRVEVVPGGIVPDEAIHWSKSNDNVTFYAGQNTGREAYIRGVTAGDFTLEISVDGFPDSYRPYIHGKVLTPTITPIHVYIVCDASGNPAVSTNTVGDWVAEANRIYRQAAMSFYVAGVAHIPSNSWYVIGNDTEFEQMCSHANVSEGLELYCVSDITFAVGLHSDPTLNPFDARCGIAVRADAIAAALAHEIGHACKLKDLKYELDDLVDETLVGIWNWSGGSGTGYHDPALKQRDLVKCVLMYHQAEATMSDIPLSDVSGTYISVGGVGSKTNAVICGLDYMEDMGREPCH